MAEHQLAPGVKVSPEALHEEPDEAEALERSGATARPTGVLSPGWVHAVHPDHGQPVVFVAGELLPAWVVDQWHRAVHEVDSGVWTIPPKGRFRR